MAERSSAHCESNLLALVAIGEPPPNDVFARHMTTCPECNAEFTRLSTVRGLAVASLGERAYMQPPGKVWAAIESSAGEAGSMPTLVIDGLSADFQPSVEPAGSRAWVWWLVALLVVLATIVGLIVA